MKIVRKESYYIGHDPMVQIKVNMSKSEYEQFSKLVEEKFTSTNNKSMPCYYCKDGKGKILKQDIGLVCCPDCKREL